LQILENPTPLFTNPDTVILTIDGSPIKKSKSPGSPAEGSETQESCSCIIKRKARNRKLGKVDAQQS
jgi:hypothetical protein